TVMTTWLEVIGSMPSAWTVAVLGRSNRHVLKLPSTKSESVAVGLCDERVSARKLEKQPSIPRAVRLIPSSRNSPRAGPELWLLSVKVQGTVIAAPFTIAKVLPLIGLPLLRATRPPVASSPVQRKTLMVEVLPPTVKSLTSRMSPSACVPVKGWPPLVVTPAFSPIGLRKNQNPAVASPLLSKRTRPAYRIWSPLGAV